MMKSVRYVGDNPTLHKGATALMRDDGKVQLDGPKDGWRESYQKDGWRGSSHMDPRCFGWHDLGDQWEENT